MHPPSDSHLLMKTDKDCVYRKIGYNIRLLSSQISLQSEFGGNHVTLFWAMTNKEFLVEFSREDFFPHKRRCMRTGKGERERMKMNLFLAAFACCGGCDTWSCCSHFVNMRRHLSMCCVWQGRKVRVASILDDLDKQISPETTYIQISC